MPDTEQMNQESKDSWSVLFLDDSEESRAAKKAIQEAQIYVLEQQVPTPWENSRDSKAPCLIAKEGSFEGLENIRFLIAQRI